MNIIYLEQFTLAGGYAISEGAAFLYTCFGPRARFLNLETPNEASDISCVFDTQTLRVFEITFSVNDRAYRWIDPEFTAAYQQECKAHQANFFQAYDDVDYIDCEVAEDLLEKITSFQRDGTFDPRVMVPLDLPDDVLFLLMKMAHQQDLTLNQLAERFLFQAIQKAETEKLSNAMTKKSKQKTKTKKKTS